MRKILITGVSGDLGGVLANGLAGDDITILGTMRRQRRPSEALPAKMTLLDGCDLTAPADCARLAAAAAALADEPFGMIHSVGAFWEHVPFENFSGRQAADMVASHLTTLYNTLEVVLPLMVRAGGGSVIAFSCNSVRYNYPWMAAFTAAKSAVESLMRTLANEYAGAHVRLNALVMASLQTERVHVSKPRGDYPNFIPPADLLPVVRFLLSPDAYLINGSSINIFRHSPRFYSEGYFDRVRK